MTIEALANRVRLMVTRAKIATCALTGRSLAQITGLAVETKQNVEVLHPFGWFANLPAGADVVMLQVMGARDHLVALGGDVLGQNMPSAAGEFGAKHGAGAFLHFTNDGKITLQDASGAALIALNNGTIEINANLRVLGDITTAAGSFGTGAMSVAGSIAATADVIAGAGSANISQLGHLHSNGNGGADTGAPIAGT